MNGTIDNNFSLYVNNLNLYFQNFLKNLLKNEIILIVLIILLIAKNILTIYQNYFQFSFVFQFSVKKAKNLLEAYLNKPYQDFLNKDISVYIKQITKDIESVYIGIIGLILISLGEIIYVIALLYFAFSLVNIYFSLEIFLILLFLVIILNRLFAISRKQGNLRGYYEELSYKYLGDALNLFKEIKIYDKSKIFIEKFNNVYLNFFSTKLKVGIINLTPKFIIEVSALFFLFYLFKNESISFDEFILKYSVFIIALIRLVLFSRLSTYISQIIFNLKSIEYIHDDVLKKYKTKKISDKKIKTQVKKLTIRNINLFYKSKSSIKKNYIFKNFSFTFKKGNIYGIYGKSGSGKTTLLNIIAGLVKSYSGTILLNNINVKNLGIKTYAKLSFATQDNVVINDNIFVNAALDNDISKNQLLELKILLKKFNLHKFAQNSKIENIQKNITKMSGGEKQRVNFIRAIRNNPDIILLDEPTSFLDKVNERKVLSYLNKIKKNKIIIVSSHKQSHKKIFDKLIYLK